MHMIKREVYEEALYQACRKAATSISKDVEKAFLDAIAKETNPAAKKGFQATLDSLYKSIERDNAACADTGWPLYFFKIGIDCQLEGGVIGLEEAARSAVARCTKAGYIRATMKHPITGYDPGNNCGPNAPIFDMKFVPGDNIEITYCAKGGGSECFGGTRQKVIAFADGVKAYEKCVIDWYVEATWQGATCPPSVLGIGIGGTANVSAHLAKQAAMLRAIGSQNPTPEFAQMERDLYDVLNDLDNGIMGVGGKTSVFAVNVEYAFTHLDGIIVSMASNCMVARRATYRINADSTMEVLDNAMWFGDR
jgi:fumarate hydratase subunit alpha